MSLERRGENWAFGESEAFDVMEGVGKGFACGSLPRAALCVVLDGMVVGVQLVFWGIYHG